jgi:hypothetical protein
MIFFNINYYAQAKKEMTLYTLKLDNLNDPIPIETTSLFCTHLNLKQLPESIGNLINLQLLDCSCNQLQELPEWIGDLENLQGLLCRCNQLTVQGIPESFGNLVDLLVLDCSDNHLQELPESIYNLSNLRTLYCENNLFTKEVNDIISKYTVHSNKAQEMLQELRDAYLIPHYNSFILK